MKRFGKFLMVIACTGLAMMAVVACNGQTLEGILKKVDMVSGNVTVQLKDGGTITFNLKDVKVEPPDSASLGTGDY